MAERIAHGVVEIEVADRDALARLKELQAAVHRTMDDIDRQKAQPEIDAHIAPFEDAVANCKREIKKFQGIKATADLEADATQADRQIRKLKAELKDLEGQKAEVELKVKADTSQLKAAEARAAAAKKELEDYKKQLIQNHQLAEKQERERMALVNKNARAVSALNKQREREEKASENARMAGINRQARSWASLERQRLSEERSVRAEQVRNDRARIAEVNRNARVASSLEKQRIGELRNDHSEAIRMERERTDEIRRQTIGVREQAREVISMQRQYAKLTDRLEQLNKRRAFGREAKAKLDLDQRDALLQMEILKAKLNALGAHPPVDIKANINEKGLARVKTTLTNMFSRVGNKLGGLADATVRVGPFTTSVRGLTAALSVLGPTLFDVAGALGALVGVTGAGIMGAGAVAGGGLAGAAAGFLGLKFATRNTGQEIAQARTSINALQSAVLKYGPTADKTKAKQQELNNVLRQISPLARESALGIERFFTSWDKLTKPTQGSLGNIAKGAFHALDAITPMWARSTNKLTATLDHSLRGAFKFLRSPEFANDFQVITNNFNKMVPALLHGLGSVGRAFFNLSREGSKFLPNMADGFDKFATSLLRFTQKDSFGDTVKRWVGDAEDIIHLFGAATRVLVHFFGAGSTAGDNLVRTMTNALNRWDDFIQSTEGHNKMADFFSNSVDGAETLYKALSPIVKLFALWATGLEPAVTAITNIFAAVTNVAGALGKLIGLGNPLATLGTTLGALWAVSKIGAFVSMLSRIPGILKEIKAAQGGFGLLKELTSGRLFQRIADSGKMGAGIEAAGTAAAAEMRAGIISGGTVAAAEMRAAAATPHMPGGTPVPGSPLRTAEKGAEDLAKTAAGAGAAETAAVAATTAVEGLSVATVGAAAAASALGVGLGFLGYKIATTQGAAEKWHAGLEAISQSVDKNAAGYDKLIGSYGDVRGAIDNSRKAVQAADKALAATKPGTDAHRKALENLKTAQNYETQAVTHWKNEVKGAQRIADKDVQVAKDQVKNYDSRMKARMADERSQIEHLKTLKQTPGVVQELNQREFVLAKQEAARAKMLGQVDYAQNQAAASGANMARVYRGMKPLIGDAEQSLGRLARVAGKTITQKIAVKYTDPQKAGAVAAAAATAVGSGVNKSVALKIVADSKTAEAAIRRLNAITLDRKKLEIIEQGGDKAVAMIERITGKKLNPKQQKIAEQGGPGVLAMLAAIIGRKLPNKSFAIRAQDYASSVVGHIQAYLNSLHDKTVTVHMKQSGRVGPLAYASGGIGADSPPVNAATARRQDRAFAQSGSIARMSTGMLQGGKKISGPRAIYGEEPQYPEYVISTNPAYRKSNARYLRMAAQTLGLDMHAGGFAPNLGLGLLNASGIPQASAGLLKQGGHEFKPSKKTKKRTSKINLARGKRGKKLSLLNDHHPWLDRVNMLEEQQGLWQQEVSFREGNVVEPDDFLTETKDANGNVNGYAIDTAAVEAFTKQLQSVKDAYDRLVTVIHDLLSAIPQAHAEAQQELSNRSFNIGQLHTAIGQQEKLLAGYKKDNAKGKNNDEIKRAEGRIARYKKQLTSEQQGRDAAKTARGDLVDKNQQASFDYRETVRSQTGYGNQIAAMNLQDPASTPNTQLATALQGLANGGADGGSGGGGADNGGLSYGEQASLVDTEKASILKQFGSNFNPNVGGPASGGPAGGGTGQNMVNNLANSLLGTSVGSSSAAASALSSSAGAAGAVSAPSGGGTVSAGGTVAAGGDSTVIVNNTFASVPPDPHTWSQGVKFELSSIV